MMEKTITAWIARDKSGELWAYISKPIKVSDQYLWVHKDSIDYTIKLNDDNFPQIKWEDEEPTEAEITIKVKGE